MEGHQDRSRQRQHDHRDMSPARKRHKPRERKHNYRDCEELGSQLPTQHEKIEDVNTWTKEIVETTEEAKIEIETDGNVHTLESRLANLIEAKEALNRKLNQQRTNRKLSIKIAEINRRIEIHSRDFGKQ
ncbi:hypothetical protein HPB48_026865 [Haemaphysalis longicornis]|uniref:Uncharacterized protein n=1 Tax=Haemaphysalis longicornis TaxID=44386 RepID=A0A9J6HCX4_HAELO|nr:hypothetical protein HPB48_026865 [Haemaphysalis longicornis]